LMDCVNSTKPSRGMHVFAGQRETALTGEVIGDKNE
jgi:hypothetical protein